MFPEIFERDADADRYANRHVRFADKVAIVINGFFDRVADSFAVVLNNFDYHCLIGLREIHHGSAHLIGTVALKGPVNGYRLASSCNSASECGGANGSSG